MKKTYTGSCHCGKVTYSAEVDLSSGTGKCNCTICSKTRNWSISMKPDDLTILTGQENETDYQWGSNTIHNYFCNTCGVRTHGSGNIPEMGGAFATIQISTIDNITPEELADLKVGYSDGLHNNWMNPPEITSYL
ncbi:MAG: GFA family protein [Candidatus Gracilibacteria bacterium]